MADWDEIKRLAADFQRAQLSSTAHKLSERNCIEIVQKLIGLGLVEVIYTTDGKEYLTPQQLEREIKDELFVHGGKYLYYLNGTCGEICSATIISNNFFQEELIWSSYSRYVIFIPL